MFEIADLTNQQYTAETAVPILSGCFTFGTALALSTLAQKVAGISTATKIIPSVFGMATVCFASLASQQAAIYTHQFILTTTTTKNKKNQQQNLPTSIMDIFRLTNNNDKKETTRTNSQVSRNYMYNEYWEIGDYIKVPKHSVRVCAVGLLTFKLLGGRFWAIAPSSITNLGSFSRWSIPCTENYATKQQRALIEQMGRRWGCHTCGSRMLRANPETFKFVGDHMPPKSVAEQMNKTWWRRVGLWRKVNYRFYPQCVDCSNKQGSILSKATSQLASRKGYLPSFMRAASLQNAGAGQMAHFHGLRPRVNHLTGGVIAGLTIVGASKKEISKGNPERFKEMQQAVQDTAKATGLTNLL